MSAITRGVFVAVLLAGAVAAVAVLPRLLAGPGGVQTPSFAVPPQVAVPAIVRARPLPLPHAAKVAAGAKAVIARRVVVPPPKASPTPLEPRPVVVRHLAPPKPVAPAPSTPSPSPVLAPVAAVEAAPVEIRASTPAPVVAASTAPVPAPAPQSVHASSTQVVQSSHGDGKAKGHDKHADRVVAAVTTVAATPVPTLGSGNAAPPSQPPSGPVGDDTGAVGPVEAADSGSTPPGHGNGPPPWAHGRGQGR